MANSKNKPVSVPFSLFWRTRFMQKFEHVYKSLSDFESWVLKAELNEVKINKPIYISSLARSGTTIISEILSNHESCAYHRYNDFPMVFTPYWKNWISQRQIKFEQKKIERSHNDRVLINNQSIEAFEEVIWKYFFKNAHKNGFANTLTLDQKHPFVSYYQDHIKKHLLIKNKSRYLAKGNYNINRIEQILSIFPDAKFIIPIRHPINHIASLMKQHRLFNQVGKANRKVDQQLIASAHFEFGKHREIIVFENLELASNIKKNWEQGKEIEGWAYYWLSIFQSVTNLLEKSHRIKKAVKLIKYEDLCRNSNQGIESILQHCELDDSLFSKIKAEYNEKLSLPEYYSLSFSDVQKNDIMGITKPIAKTFGYTIENHH